MRVHVCGPASKVVPEIIGALNGGTVPVEVVVGGMEVYFAPPDAATKRHALVHVKQSARFAPRWMELWLPLRIRAWFGAPRFWRAYKAEHDSVGYALNKFELEARAAEHLSSTEDTPVL